MARRKFTEKEVRESGIADPAVFHDKYYGYELKSRKVVAQWVVDGAAFYTRGRMRVGSFSSGLNHTSHDGSRSTDAGRTAKMEDRGKLDEPAIHPAKTTGTGYTKMHAGLTSRTQKMVGRSDKAKPASY